MNKAVEDLFTRKFDFDDRVPSVFVTLPIVGGGKIGVTPFIPIFWLQSVLCFILGSFINVVVAFFLYHFLLTERRKDSAISYVIGYGVIVPLLLLLPWFLIRLLDLKNIAILLSLSASFPSLSILRCVEAIHGTLPVFAVASFQNFILYFSATIGFQFNFDPKTHQVIRLTRQELIHKLHSFVRHFLETTIYLSILLPRDFSLFSRKEEGIFDFCRQMLNNLFLAFLFTASMETGSKGVSLVASILTGCSTTEMSDRPLTASTSFAEFWGRRWNRIMASGLRRGVFQPIRQAGFSRPAAALVTFIASGLFHEYLLLIMTWRGGIPNNPGGIAYTPKFGCQTMFFAWNGLLLVMESLLQHTPPIVWIRAYFPKPFLTALVLLSVLPLGHLFIDEYVAAGYFSDQAWGFPQFVWLRPDAKTSVVANLSNLVSYV